MVSCRPGRRPSEQSFRCRGFRADGNKEERRGIVSVFNGLKQAILICDLSEKEIDVVAQWISERNNEGKLPHEIGVFVRSEAQLPRAQAAA